VRRLPPLAELVAFEAVARRQSFTLAAQELGLTQSAISHRVRRLEQHFGTRLLRRLNPGLALTDAGVALLPELVAALDGLARLGRKPDRLLRVAAASALCTWWLAGRLAGFVRQRPGVSIELVPIEAGAASIPEVDVRILWVGAGEDRRGATQAPLFHEHVFPVCSPRLLNDGPSPRSPDALRSMTLLHKAAHSTGEWSWQVWLDRFGIDLKAHQAGELRFADMGLILSAAVEGSGIALARSLLVHAALKNGRLVVPFAGVEPMLSTKKHVARWRSSMAGDRDIETFVGWLTAEAAQTLDEVDQLIAAAPADAGRNHGRALAS
jgi:LysR family transcriptional regulator, glycine cleavage system transcriptional activator